MIIEKDLRANCVYCNQSFPVKITSVNVDNTIKEIVFNDSHDHCAKKQNLIELLQEKIEEHEMVLMRLKFIKLRLMSTTLKSQIVNQPS